MENLHKADHMIDAITLEVCDIEACELLTKEKVGSIFVWFNGVGRKLTKTERDLALKGETPPWISIKVEGGK